MPELRCGEAIGVGLGVSVGVGVGVRVGVGVGVGRCFCPSKEIMTSRLLRIITAVCLDGGGLPAICTSEKILCKKNF